MANTTINATVNGSACEIVIDTDPSWGKMQQLLNSVVVSDGKGGQRIDMNAFFNKILETTIVSGLPFDVKDRTKLMQVPTSEMTTILGEILKVLPLQQYFKNLGISENGLLSNL